MASTRSTIFPSLLPSQLDQAWFNGSYNFTNENAISKMEEAYESWKMGIRSEGSNVLPYGKVTEDQVVDHEDTYVSGSDNTSEDDLDTDVLDDQDSLQDVDMGVDINAGNNNDMEV